MDNSRTGLIYIIRNRANEKVYIGQTTKSETSRFNDHRSASKTENNKLYFAMRKHKVENFYIDTVEDNIPEPMLDEKETYYIEIFDSFRNGYNSTTGGRTFRKILNLPTKEQLTQWNGKMSQVEIARIFECSDTTIREEMRKYNIVPINIKSNIKKPTLEQLNEWNGKKSYKEISEIIGCSISTVDRTVRKYNLNWEKSKYKGEKISISYPSYDELIKINGVKTQQEIANDLGCSLGAISKYINKLDIEWKNPRYLNIEISKDVLEKYNGIKSQEEVASLLGVPSHVVVSKVKSYNIKWKRLCKSKINISKDDIEKYNGIKSQEEVGVLYNVNRKTIQALIKEYNIDWKRPTKKSS